MASFRDLLVEERGTVERLRRHHASVEDLRQFIATRLHTNVSVQWSAISEMEEEDARQQPAADHIGEER